ncbi:hypothetical protein MMC25_006007 [Agyrium rufum]|nr:hypothetical protein [Agyrium rufum]
MTNGERKSIHKPAPTPTTVVAQNLSSLSVNTPSARKRSFASVSEQSLKEYPYEQDTESFPGGYDLRKRTSYPLLQLDNSRFRRIAEPESKGTATEPKTDHTVFPSQVCLCQPDPKVPRPRNAFILYRQHYQSGVNAQHPGLSNPEISKIIGDLWKAESENGKNHWKALAEEEKLRHQKQYPEYRYQPRRAGRSHITTLPLSPSLQHETPECVKCGGKRMATPSLPSTSSTVSNASIPSAPGTGNSVQSAHLTIPSASSLSSTGSRYLPSTPMGLEFERSNMPARNNINQMRCYAEPTSPNPTSPDTKRRRLAHGCYNPPVPTPYPFQHRRPSLPRPEFMPRNINMGAPPHPLHHATPQSPRASISNPTPQFQSTTLAPLKIVPVPSHRVSLDLAEQARSVEAMIMSIPPINKIRVLAKISPPLPHPGPTSPPHATRGAIVAIDGSSPENVRIVMSYLRDFLARDGEHAVKVWENPIPEMGVAVMQQQRRSQVAHGGTLAEHVPSPEATKMKTFGEYLGLITQWHVFSGEIIKFITTVPGSHSPKHQHRIIEQMATIPERPRSRLSQAEDVECIGEKRNEKEKDVHKEDNSIDVDIVDGSSAAQAQGLTQRDDRVSSGDEAGEDVATSSSATTAEPMRDHDISTALSQSSPSQYSTPLSRSTNPYPYTAPNPDPDATPTQSTFPLSHAQPQSQSSSSSRPTSSSFPPPSSKIPIALIPQYQLSFSNAYASRIPIQDSYAPIDHWQWLATLWRGIVGPDITIVVKSVHSVPSGGTAQGAAGTGSSGVGGGGDKMVLSDDYEALPTASIVGGDARASGSGRGAGPTSPNMLENGRKGNIIPAGGAAPGVEVRLADARTVVVRGTGEKELRRVAFEVGEWVRSLGERG